MHLYRSEEASQQLLGCRYPEGPDTLLRTTHKETTLEGPGKKLGLKDHVLDFGA